MQFSPWAMGPSVKDAHCIPQASAGETLVQIKRAKNVYSGRSCGLISKFLLLYYRPGRWA